MDEEKKSGVDNPVFELNGEVLENGNKKTLNEVTPTKERAQWDNGMEFLMSCIAMSVGLGNIWRFPFTAYENGGGAFLIPYIVVLTVIGRPLYYMEMALGQFCNRGNVKFFKSLSPYLKGVGYGQLIGSACVATYYCSLMAITIFFLCQSFTSDLPWGQCMREWDSYLEKENKICVASVSSNSSQENSVSSAELYFTREVLKESADINQGIGEPEWRLTLCLLAAWTFCCFVTIKGVKSSGKVSYFLAIFPYVIMITLLIKAATLEGAADGMYYFIKTDWNKLLEPDVWYAAVTQCFFSLNVGFGTIVMFASYNSFDRNINRDALIITTLDTFTSLLSGVTIFGILGNLAYHLHVTPDKVIGSGGTGLAFISYPDAIAKMDAVPWLFSILFFFMLFVLGIGSLVALQGISNTVLQDIFPNLATWKITLITGSCGFLIGLIYVTPGGQFMLNLVDYYGGTFVIYIFVILEITGVTWFYGLENFCIDLEYMTKKKVNIYWRLTWGFITPLLLIIIFIYFCVKYKPLTYNGVDYPGVVLGVGWAIVIIAALQFLFWIVSYIYTHRENGLVNAIRKTFSHDSWGPSGESRREDWIKYREDERIKRKLNQRNFVQRYLGSLIGR